jgi:hypothetical protein
LQADQREAEEKKMRRGLILMATMLWALLLGSRIALAAEIIGTNGGDKEPSEAPQTAPEQPRRGGEPQAPPRKSAESLRAALVVVSPLQKLL